MSAKYQIVIDAAALEDVAQPDRDWLGTWLYRSKLLRRGDLYTIAIGSRTEIERVIVMLTGHGLPQKAIIARGAA